LLATPKQQGQTNSGLGTKTAVKRLTPSRQQEKQRHQSEPKREPNKPSLVKARIRTCKESPKQTKKLSTTTEADADKPKPAALTPERLTLR